MHTRGLAVDLSVCLSLRLSNVCIVTKLNNLLPKFLHYVKDPLIQFFRQEERLVEILGQTDSVGAKTPIFNRFSLVTPQP